VTDTWATAASGTATITAARIPPDGVGQGWRLRYRRDWRAAHGAIRRLLADKEDTRAVFDIMRALSGRSVPDGYARLVDSPQGGRMAMEAAELQPLLDDHDALRQLPPGTVGRAYVEFVSGRMISAGGLAEESRAGQGNGEIDSVHPYAWYARRLRDVHDLWHVLTGYRTDALGEVCVVAFSYAQTRSLGFALIAVAGALKLRREMPGQPVLRAAWQAWRHGRKAAWLPLVDYQALLGEPLEGARARLRIAAPGWYLAIPPATGALGEAGLPQAA
jgi:ubiquinone biosynthesis protein COQ4